MQQHHAHDGNKAGGAILIDPMPMLV